MKIDKKIDKSNIEDIIKLTPLQEGILFHYLSNPESKQYNEQLWISIYGHIEEDLFEKAWDFVINTNEMLRTLFRWDKLEHPIQMILKKLKVKIEKYNLTGSNYGKSDLENIREKIRTTPVNIETEPFKIVLIKVEKEKYELIIINHHILYDGWSNAIILNEFMVAYKKLLNREPLLDIQKNKFKEYIKWFENKNSKEQRFFWSDYLNGFNERSIIPKDFIESKDNNKISKFSYSMSDDEYMRITSFCSNSKITLAVLLYTAWGVVLQRYCNTSDILFGITVSGRSARVKGIESMVGLFINTIPMRVTSSDTDRFKTLLNKVEQQLKNNEEYEHTSLTDIKSFSSLTGQEEIFDSIFVVENYPVEKELQKSTPGLHIVGYENYERTNYPLTITVELKDSVKINYVYEEKLFKNSTIENLSACLMNVVNQIITNPDAMVKQSDLTDAEQRNRLLYSFNDTQAEYPDYKIIHRMFEEQAASTPDNIAAIFENKQLTYRELNKKANQLARVLREKGIKQNNIVGIVVNRSFEMIIGIIGILKAGGAYLPIDPEYPRERIEYMLEDSSTNILLTSKQVHAGIGFNGDIIDLDDHKVFRGDMDDLEPVNEESDLAYLIYTSGSTGKPKGVMIEHRNVINFIFGIRKDIDIRKSDSVLAVTTICFDIFGLETLLPLAIGAKIVLANEREQEDSALLNKLIFKHKVDVLQLTPSRFQLLREYENIKECFKYVRSLIIGGEAFSQAFYKNIKGIVNDKTNVYNVYGPTETTIWSTVSKLKADENITIGKPISNTRIYIIDQNNNLQPEGAIGEICIAGDGLARGYFNKPDLTVSKFIANPFELGTYMYRTGDLGRWLSDGRIEFLGRMDHQVKIRGFRIELGEIESTLLSHEDIKEAVVTTKEDAGNKYICAYLIGKREISITKLNEHIRKKLPDYMVPSYYMQIDSLPLTLNGKIDRKALPEPGIAMSSGTGYEAPRNKVEQDLARLFEDVLNVSNIEINDNFFELGGHSLKVTKLASKIHKQMDMEIPIRVIFNSPTVKGLADYIRCIEKNIYTDIRPLKEMEYYQLSSAQKRLYTLQQFEKSGTAYNMPGAVILNGNIDINRLENALRILTQRHESLRTSFIYKDREPVQEIHKEVEIEIEYRTANESETEKLVKEFIRPFELSKAPLFRAGLIKVHQGKHILLFDMHHIISDGTSIGIIVDEFSKLYGGKILPEQRIQYKDYAAWQNRMKYDSSVMKEQELYWIKEFEGEIPVLSLPTDYARPINRSFEGDRVYFELSNEETERLRRVAKEAGTTVFMMMLASFNILLSKYSGQEDIVVGSPVAGRRHADLENIIGVFVNTMAIRCKPAGEKTFKEFLMEVKDKCLCAFENQDYPFEELVEKLNIRRDTSRNPLFDAMFVLQNTESKMLNLDGLELQEYVPDKKLSKFDLLLEAIETDKKIKLSIEYCTKLFTKETAKKLAGYLKNILKHTINNADKKLYEIDMMDDEDKFTILHTFNNTDAQYMNDKTLHELFEEQVRKTPDKTAVIYGNDKLSYAELAARVNRLAVILRSKGVSRDSIVGIMLDRSLEMIIGIIAILKAGGAYLPIDPRYPADRIEFIMDDSNASLLLVKNNQHGSLVSNIELVNLDDMSLYKAETGEIESINSSCDLAYIIYTSGSTGKPKGVMIEHHSVINRLSWMQKKYSLDGGDIILQKTPFTFDVSVWELFWWSFGGAGVCMLEQGWEKDPAKIVETIEEERITTMHFVPSMLGAFLEYLNDNKESISRLRSLKRVFASGEVLNLYQVNLFNQLLTEKHQVKLHNLYGPTEATVDVSYFDCSDIGDINTIPIGKPIDNIKLYILNKHNNLQPIGVVGELYIAGVGLARGYLNRSELTAEKFIVNPFDSSGRMYKTGDLARWLPDGNVEFLGRLDHQVKIRGFRIELGEIESQLLKSEMVKGAVVLARIGKDNNSYLCAYIVASTKDIEITYLMEFLSKDLPDYMIPSAFVVLDEIPLSANGKVDRKALPEPIGAMLNNTEYEAPRNDMEAELVRIWEEILNVEKVGINDNFFLLGGHSLKAISLVSRIHKSFSGDFPLKEVFKSPTVKGIAAAINDLAGSVYLSIDKADEKEYYNVTSAQKRYYILQQFDSEGISYNIPGAWEVLGTLGADKVKQIFDILIERHESFRTSFEIVEEEILQKIHKEVNFEIEYKEAKEEEIDQVFKSFVKPFDLNKAPLLRVGLIKVHPEKHILMYDMHHIISDGTSMRIMIEEFIKLYEGTVLPEQRIQYKDYAEWDMKNEFNDIRKQEEYWLNTLKGEIPTLEVPLDYPRKSIQTFKGNTLQLELESKLVKRLQAVAQRFNTTMNTLLLSFYSILLSKLSGQDDIMVGSVVSNRNHADLENVIGVFINFLPIRFRVRRDISLLNFIESHKRIIEEAYDNREYPFDKMVENSTAKTVGNRKPIFYTMLIYHNEIEKKAYHVNGSLLFRPCELHNDTSNMDFKIDVIPIDNGALSCFLEYNTGLFKEESMKRFIGSYKYLLNKYIDNPDIKISDIEILNEEEKSRVLNEFNNTYMEFPKDKAVHELFEEQVGKTPNSVAVVYEDKMLTYKELNKIADKLAWKLREKGVGPDSIVGVMIERSVEMVAGIMGVLKAGGAYLPIDPEYPADRIKYMADDSGANIILIYKNHNEDIGIDKEKIFDIGYILDNQGKLEGSLNIKYRLDRPIYVIYTSGSTGNPKGAIVKSNSFTNLINWYTKDFEIGEEDNILLIAPVSFDLAQKNLYATLVKGGKLCIFPDNTHDYAKALQIIEKERITIVNCTPSAFQLLIGTSEDYSELKSLRYVFLGGEPINTAKLLEWANSEYYHAEIVNTYGPTECTDIATYYRLPNDRLAVMTNVPIGKPIDNIKLYVLDNENNLKGIGQLGELCISGISVGSGYLGSPELTAEKFVDNPFEPGTKMYRTGDLTRWLDDGNIEFLGRIDHQVKISGYRIETGETESCLIKHEQIDEAAVVAREDESGMKYLCAYIVGAFKQSVNELREYLGKELPKYMIPSKFVKLERMPLTPSGKIDRKALPEPEENLLSENEYEAPRNELEERLVSIWKEVLGVEIVGVNNNFFDLGGHSLKAASLVAKIHRVLDVQVPIREIFNSQTIRELSNYIISLEENIFSNIEVIERNDYYELSSAQKRIYTLQQLDIEGTSYNIPGVLEIEGELDVERLRYAFKKLIARHESLRTSFHFIDEGVVQKVHDYVDFEIEYTEAVEEVASQIVKKFVRAFDLSKVPLLRVGLIKVRPDKYMLIYDMHHIISDGVSIVILVEEFAKLYEGKELPELKIQYKDYAAWQNKTMKKEVLMRQEEYWVKEYEGEIPVLNLLTDYPRPMIQSFEGDKVHILFDRSITKNIRKLAKETETTLYMILLANLSILLSKYSGQEDIIIGSPIAGRPHADLENIIGMMANTLAIRSQPEGKKTIREFLEEVKIKALSAYDNQDYQFEELVERLNIRRDVSRNPIFDVMLVLQNTGNTDLEIEGLNINRYASENKISKFDITLNVVEKVEAIEIELEYSTNLFKRETIERFGNHLKNVAIRILENLDIKISEIDMLTEEEKELLYESNDTYAEYPMNKTIYKLFEEQVERTPQNVAVVYKDRQLTYRELNERANQLARVLREKGVVADSVVSIIIDKSLEMVIGMMGIMKAGGAFLPIDPEYPEKRILDMLEDSRTLIILAKENTIENISVSGCEILLLDRMMDALSEKPGKNLEPFAGPENLVYVIYTSGSTGKPKGVMLEHKNLVNLIYFEYQKTSIEFETKVLQFSTISFDVCYQELFSTLLKGGELHVIDNDKKRDIEQLFSFIQVNDIETVVLPTALLKFIMGEEYAKKFPNCVKNIITAGEQLLVTDIFAKHLQENKIHLHNHYGPSETHVVSAYVMGPEEDIPSIPPIGKPISNTKMYIADRYLKPVPIGIVGEIYIAGDNVGRGYLNRPDLTLEKFVPNPFEPGTRMYKTGDLGRWLPDGNIEFLGRIDHQVKIRGFRIELGEIEKQLLSHESIREAVVVARNDNKGIKYLCAYIVGERLLTTREMRNYLSKVLPDYMIPAYFIQLDKMPLTPNGKIDRKALPESNESLSSRFEYEAPRNEVEEKLVKIWEEVLDIDKVGIYDNFFEIGGHSLLIMRIIIKIKDLLNTEITIRDFYASPTIVGINQLIEVSSNKYNLTVINKTLSDKFSGKNKIVKYMTDKQEYTVFYTEKYDERMYEFLKEKYSSFIIPNYIREYQAHMQCDDSILVKNEEELNKILNLKRITEKELNRIQTEVKSNIDLFKMVVLSSKITNKFRIGYIINYKCKRAEDKISRPISNYIIDFSGQHQKHFIKKNLTKLINDQSVLRMTVDKSNSEYLFVEHMEIKAIDFFIIDLAEFDLSSKIKAIEEIFKCLNYTLLTSDYLNNPLYYFVIVKIDEQRFSMLLSADHQIVDIHTPRIIEKYFTLNNNETLKFLPFMHYMEKIYLSDVKDKFIKFNNSEIYTNFMDSAKLFHDKYPQYPMEQRIVLSPPLSILYEPNVSEKFSLKETPIKLPLYITVKIINILFELDVIPLRVFVNRRILGNLNFYYTLGDFTDSITCTFQMTGEDIISHCYNEYVATEKYFIEEDILLKGLIKDVEWSEPVYRYAPFTFNYLGEISCSEDFAKLDLMNNRTPIPYPVLSYSTDSGYIRFIFPNGIKMEELNSIKLFLDSLGGEYEIDCINSK